MKRRIDPSLIVILAIMLYFNYRSGAFSNPREWITSMLIMLPGIIVGLSFHEFAHGFVSYRLGDPTPKIQGRLTINPMAHIEPVGFIALLLCGFGWAKPVPVDMRYFKKPKQGMAVTALAGPLSNFALAFVCVLIGKAIYLYAPYNAVFDWIFSFCLFSVAPLSVGLGLFNLIPIPPLDGSKVAAVLLPDRAYAWQMRYERFGMLLLLALSALDVGSNLISGGIYAIYSGMVNLVF